MTDEDLEKIIAALVKRKWDDATGDAEREMIERVLNGLRYKYEMAGPIWEVWTTVGVLRRRDAPSCRPAADSKPTATRPVGYSGFLYGRITP